MSDTKTRTWPYAVVSSAPDGVNPSATLPVWNVRKLNGRLAIDGYGSKAAAQRLCDLLNEAFDWGREA